MSASGEAAAPDDDAADRIERALERIAAMRAQPAPVAGDGAGAAMDPELGPRLDGVIARLREALGH